MIVILALLGGLCYRIRGGFLDDILRVELPNILNRSIWAAFLAFIVSADVLMFVLVFLAALAGVIPSYWGGKFDLSLKENRAWKNYAWLSVRGAFIVLPIALCFGLLYPHLWYGVLAGALMPICYLIGVGIHRLCKIQGHSQWGEWLIGTAIVGLMLWMK